MHALAGDRLGDLGRRDVLGDVARFEPRHDDVVDAGRFQRRDFGGADQRALLEHQRALADGMHGGRAERVLWRDRTEFHDAALPLPTLPASGGGQGGSASSRSRSVICAMIATAISAGETAPMSSPIGAWMRARSASVRPCCLSRSSRRAWVFREPSAPI